MHNKKVILLAGEWDTTPVVFDFLKRNFGTEKAIIEKPVARNEFLKKRIKKLGWFTVGGQVMFQLSVARLLAKRSGKRIAEILKEYGLQKAPLPEEQVHRVTSVNDEACLKQLQAERADIVVVHGTRIISKKILQQSGSTFINIHAGITPRYRGSHGAYWALASKDKDHCGVTVHLVDAGIDTGNILAQGTIHVTPRDNFITYPYLQLAEGLQLLKKVLTEADGREWKSSANTLNSALWHHPTLWGYLYNRVMKGVK